MLVFKIVFPSLKVSYLDFATLSSSVCCRQSSHLQLTRWGSSIVSPLLMKRWTIWGTWVVSQTLYNYCKNSNCYVQYDQMISTLFACKVTRFHFAMSINCYTTTLTQLLLLLLIDWFIYLFIDSIIYSFTFILPFTYSCNQWTINGVSMKQYG